MVKRVCDHHNLHKSIYSPIDVDGDTLTVQIITQPTKGTLVQNAQGQWTYTPAANANGADTFTYRVSDGTLQSGIVTAALQITPVNDAPVANADAASTQRNTAVRVAVLVNDTDVDSAALSVVIASQPANGIAVLNADGSVQYTPNANFTGTDTFTYRASDGALQSAPVSVTITVLAGNRPPVVNGVIVSTNEDSTIVIAPLVNTTDPDGDSLTVLSIGSSTLGTLQSLGNNTYRFTPTPNLSGSGTIAFTVSDGTNVVSGSISLTVQAVADAPQLSLVGGSSVTREVLRTGFESAANTDQYSTNVIQSTFEGWTLITTPDAQAGGTNGFEIWTTGDQQQNAAGTFATVAAKTGNGVNFLELNNAAGTNAQTLGISRSIATVAGAQYTLSFDYAGRPGFTTDFTKVGVFVDGLRVGTAANTSPSTSLNWQALSYTFVGNGSNQVVSFVSEATAFNAGGRGAMLDNIALTESIPRNQGLEDTAILLSGIASLLVDTER